MPRIRQSIAGSSFTTGSGFIIRSPRILLNELDDNPGSYPTVLRTGDHDRSGGREISFDDGTTIDFLSDGSPAFPMMLPKNSPFMTQSVDIIGEQSDISITAPIRSFQHPAHLHYSPVEEMGPFDENRSMPATDFYLSGTDPDVLPGFTSPVRSKIAIEIDITPQSDTMVMRNVRRRNVAEGQPVSDDNTGFLYYNFDRREWEQIGVRDPGTGNSLYYDYAADFLAGSSEPSGTFPMQFLSTTDLGLQDTSYISQLGYPKIGTPIATLGAPFATKYHATSSQSLKLGDFIKHPFLLESVRVSFNEVNAQRVNGCVSPSLSLFSSFTKSGSIRDIDNYVFFAYRQSRQSRSKDTLLDVSGSSRYLIFSGSMAFWNSDSLYSGILHGPSFDHNFGLPYTDSYAVGSFTGSISMNLKPAASGPQFVGFSSVPDADGSGTKFVYGVWPGGNSNENYPGLQKSHSSLQMHLSSDGIQQISSKFGKIDPRSTRKFGGETAENSEDSSGFPVSISTPSSNDSPYLLLPEDELIFGVEAGVAPAAYSSNFSHITGSFLRISSKPCKVTLYGSLISDSREYLPSLNQDLSSDSIHEIIGAEPVLDQFQIEPISSYYGSYLDEIVTGSMVNPILNGTAFITYDQDNSRRVISRVSSGQAGTTGSLQRFSTVLDSSETIYDSCLPDYFDLLNLNADDSEYKYRGDAVIRYDAPSFDQIYETGESFESSVKQFPFEGNPKRRTRKTAAILSVGSQDVASDPIDLKSPPLDPLDVVYLTRYAFLSTSPAIDLPDYTNNFFPISYGYAQNVSDNLVSSYFLTSSSDNLLRDNSSLGNDMTLNPDFGGGAHPKPATSTVVPVSNLEDDGSLRFPTSPFVTSDADVRVIADTTGIIDHQMTDMVDDFPFSISITFRLAEVGIEKVLVERAYRNAGAFYLCDYRLSITSGNKVEFRIFNSSNPARYKGVRASGLLSNLAENVWYNVTVTYNGDKSETAGVNCMKIYINGTSRSLSESSSSPAAGPMYTNAGSRLWIGAEGAVLQSEPVNLTKFVGHIHSTHIWKDRALTPNEIRDVYRAELYGTTLGYIKNRASQNLMSYDGPVRTGTYRYGIANINPSNSLIHASSVHFGHTRDMFEQRKDTATVSGQPPISCKFVSGTVALDPNLTFSQNLSTFATSSVPYFDDGTFRNRSDDPDVTLLIV